MSESESERESEREKRKRKEKAREDKKREGIVNLLKRWGGKYLWG